MFTIIWHVLDTCLEAGILIVLVIEFNYDKIQLEKKHYKKKTSPKPTFEELSQGESK